MLAGLIVPGSLLGQVQSFFEDTQEELSQQSVELKAQYSFVLDELIELQQAYALSSEDSVLAEYNEKAKEAFVLKLDIDLVTLHISRIDREEIEEDIQEGRDYFTTLDDINEAIGTLSNLREEVEEAGPGDDLTADFLEYLMSDTRVEIMSLRPLVMIDQGIEGINKANWVLEGHIKPGIEEKGIENDELDKAVAAAEGDIDSAYILVNTTKATLDNFINAEPEDRKDLLDDLQAALRSLKASVDKAGSSTELAYRLFKAATPTRTPVVCKYGDWGSWDKCTGDCGEGTQTRTREVLSGGDKCRATTDSKPCSNKCEEYDNGIAPSSPDIDDTDTQNSQTDDSTSLEVQRCQSSPGSDGCQSLGSGIWTCKEGYRKLERDNPWYSRLVLGKTHLYCEKIEYNNSLGPSSPDIGDEYNNGLAPSSPDFGNDDSSNNDQSTNDPTRPVTIEACSGPGETGDYRAGSSGVICACEDGYYNKTNTECAEKINLCSGEGETGKYKSGGTYGAAVTCVCESGYYNKTNTVCAPETSTSCEGAGDLAGNLIGCTRQYQSGPYKCDDGFVESRLSSTKIKCSYPVAKPVCYGCKSVNYVSGQWYMTCDPSWYTPYKNSNGTYTCRAGSSTPPIEPIQKGSNTLQ